MTNTAAFHSFRPAATLLGRGVQSARRRQAVPMVHQRAALWQQSVRINEGRSMIERLACLLLILFAAAAVAYGALVTVRTFRGGHFQQAVARIANHDARQTPAPLDAR